MSRALDKKPEMTESRAAYYQRISEYSMAPLWEVLHTLLAKEPVTGASPHVWDYASLRATLLQSAEIISAEEAERRVLVLENPTLRGQSCITEALYAGLQLIMPGEKAPTHRHSPAALRFIIEGDRAFTALNGEKAYMEPGDLILTPSWVWHDHGHDGDQPVVWLDGLDIPMVRNMGPTFVEQHPDGYHERTYAAGDNMARYGANMMPMGSQDLGLSSPVFHYPYAKTRDALEHMAKGGELDPCHGIKMEYINPSNGLSAMPTLGSYMQWMPKGFSSESFRSTAGWVYSPVEGSGRTIVGEQVIEWKPRDVFVIPPWQPHSHELDEDSYLFSFTEKPMHEKLGWYREIRG